MKKYLALATLTAAIGMAILSTAAVKADRGGTSVTGVKARQNDCKTTAQGLSWQSLQDQRQSDFLMVPAGLCSKIAAGATKGGASHTPDKLSAICDGAEFPVHRMSTRCLSAMRKILLCETP